MAMAIVIKPKWKWTTRKAAKSVGGGDKGGMNPSNSNVKSKKKANRKKAQPAGFPSGDCLVKRGKGKENCNCGGCGVEKRIKSGELQR